MASSISPQNQDSSSIDDLREEIERMSLEDEDCWNLHFKSSNKTPTEPQLNTNLGDKYQPKHFKDIVGHDMTVKAISRAVEKMKVAPLYLFHGPGGTGKTSTARIFASALTCESSTSQVNKPCWSCSGCSRTRVVVGSKGIKTLFQSTSLSSQEIPGFKVFVAKECHSFPAETWDELLGLAGRGLYENGVVFVLVATDVNSVPATVSSRCQKFGFLKLKEREITLKLERIVASEDMVVDTEALRVITVKAQGSLREAENLLDQMALLGSTITSSMVQQLAGLLPRDTLLDLLTAAISGDTVETVRHTRELMSTSIEPQALISQLVSLVTEILSTPVAPDSASSSAGSSKEKQLLRGSHLTNTQLERLCRALKILVEMEKQLRSSSSTDHDSTVYGALLDITSGDFSNKAPTVITFPRSRTSNSGGKPNADSEYLNKRRFSRSRSHTHHRSLSKTCQQSNTGRIEQSPVIIKGIYQIDRYRGKEVGNANDMEDIWQNMLGQIQSGYIKEFLRDKVKLASLTVSSANIIVHLMFRRHEDKMTAQMSEDSISRALEKATGCPVTVNMSWEPIDSGIIRAKTNANEQSCTPSKQKQKMLPLSRDSFHSKNSEAETRLNSQRESYPPPLSENSRPAKYKEGTNYQRQDMYLLEEKESTTAWPQKVSSIRGHVTPKNHVGKYRDPESDTLTREQTSEDKGHIITANKPRHRWLSLSSIPQCDASVEPYSQDILFEKANKERERNTTQANKFQKSFFNASEDRDLPERAMHRQLNNSWRCNEAFCSRKTEGRTSKP